MVYDVAELNTSRVDGCALVPSGLANDAKRDIARPTIKSFRNFCFFVLCMRLVIRKFIDLCLKRPTVIATEPEVVFCSHTHPPTSDQVETVEDGGVVEGRWVGCQCSSSSANSSAQNAKFRSNVLRQSSS